MTSDPEDVITGAEQLEVQHRPEEQQYVVELDGHTAFLRYERRGRTLVLVHTEVPPEFEGRGIGSFLVKSVLDEARDGGLVIAPVCPFVRSFIRENPEYRDLVSFDDPTAGR